MNIIVSYRQDIHKGTPVGCYARSFVKQLESMGHKVQTVGEGHEYFYAVDVPQYKKRFDLYVEIENGRNHEGVLGFHHSDGEHRVVGMPTAVWFIDSHGNPTLHHRIAGRYHHVFFAVWSKRDIFAKHNSVHFLPSGVDLEAFGKRQFEAIEPTFDFGFFGSKGGLSRAAKLKEACEKLGLTYDVRQINKGFKHRWPHTGEAMSNCKRLFNHGQKHDINQRIFESMATGRPLLNDHDVSSGIDKLFVAGYHYIPYESYTCADLQEQVKWMLDHPNEVAAIAEQGYNEVLNKHTIGHRVSQFLETVRA